MKAKGREALANFVFTDKYAHSVDNYTRRETKEEVVSRLINMHKDNFKDHPNHVMIHAKLDECHTAIMNNEIMPSMRSLQNSPYAINKNNTRIYNCAASPLDRVEFFKQLTFVLLSGCGVGFSVIPENIQQLPEINTPDQLETKLFMVPDSIEGWSDSMDFLVRGLFEGYNVEFNYNFVRPEGSIIKGSVGLAPGPEPLKKAHDNLKKLINRIRSTGQTRVTSVDATDICCFIADCVRSGGIRRSALICLFDPDDQAMVEFKAPKNFSFQTGKNLHRQQVNVSSLIGRDIPKPELKGLIEFARDYFEPGILLSDNKFELRNPCCQPQNASVIIKGKGLATFADMNEGDEIWSREGWTKVVKKWSTGVKSVYRTRTRGGVFLGTLNHRVETKQGKQEIQRATEVRVCKGPVVQRDEILDSQDVMDGMFLGRGYYRENNTQSALCVGPEENAHFESEVGHLMDDSPLLWGMPTVKITIAPAEVENMFNKAIPARFFSDNTKLAGLLRGLFAVSATVGADGIELKTASSRLRDDVQLALSTLGIQSSCKTKKNKNKEIILCNGEYTVGNYYSVRIHRPGDMGTFAKLIGFVQPPEADRLSVCLVDPRLDVVQYAKIVNKEYMGEEEVFDITVDNESHTYWTGGLSVSNCEIGLWPYVDAERTRSCFHFCNLTTINMKNISNQAEMNRRADLAAFLGTIQSSYTTFEYLGPDTEFVTRRENLLGVSMTGIRDNQDMNKVREAISQGSRFVKDRARVYSKLIGVNMPARITTCKPEGSCSKVMSTASGVHRDFYKTYIQRIVAKKDSAIVQHVLKTIPEAWEANPYDPTGQAGYLLFPIETAHGGKDTVEEQLSLIKFLQKEWINPASSQELCVVPMQHSVSNTVSFRDEDFDTMVDIIHEDREWHSGISFQAESNPFAYPNSPITPVNLDQGHSPDLLQETPYTVDPDQRQQWANARFLQLKEAFDTRQIDWDNVPSNSPVDLNFGTACAGGACDLD